MNADVLKTLEFDKVKERLLEHAHSAEGASLCKALLPFEDLSDAKRALCETQDAAVRLAEKGSISFSGVKGFRSEIKALAVSATLEMRALLDFASFLENVSRVCAYGIREKDAEAPDTLTDYFHALTPLDAIAAQIRRAILSEGEIAPDASSALKQIRRQMTLCQEKIRDVLGAMIGGATRAYLQDGVVTMRGDRYCLPVRTEYKAKVRGIVHDRSKGGATLFIEPEAVVDLNNRLRELMIEEEQEIARILAALSAELADHLDAIRDNVTYMSLLDFIFAKAAYGLEQGAQAPAFSADKSFFLKEARHPLIERDKVVPIDIRLGVGEEEPFHLLVITGPNTGGKTVTLKTAGLLTLMAMSGLLIPAAEGTVVAFFDEIYADIGDEQSIEQSLSTFSSHMTRIVHILRDADERSLCLFDEPGAGTDPTEGAALAISILNHLLRRGVSMIATTHYAELKVYAMTTKGVKNASCAFDVDTLRPTYRLIIGAPGASNAFAISKKLGLPEEVIEDAHAQIDSDKARMETLFQDLEESKKRLDKEQEKVERYREEQQELQARLKEQEEAFDTLGDDILEEAHRKAEDVLAEAKRFADMTIRRMRKAHVDEELISSMERERTHLNEMIGKVREEKPSQKEGKADAAPAMADAELIPGTRVRIRSMGLGGIIKTAPDKDGRLTVTCGVMQVEARADDLVPEEEEAYSGKEIAKRFSMKRAFAEKDESKGRTSRPGGTSASYVPAEINLIGKNTDDALALLDKYLDDAYLTHLPVVRIVHGKGTGALRSAVQRHLKGISYVKSFQGGAYGEGDAGVTVVKLKG